MGEARVFKFYTQAISSISLGMTNCPKMGVDRIMTHVELSWPLSYLSNGWS